MGVANNLKLRAGLLSALILVVILGIWYVATAPSGAVASGAGLTPEQIEYAQMMGQDPSATKTDGFPTLAQMGQTVWSHLSQPFYDNGPNDKAWASKIGRAHV